MMLTQLVAERGFWGQRRPTLFSGSIWAVRMACPKGRRDRSKLAQPDARQDVPSFAILADIPEPVIHVTDKFDR